MNMFSQGSDGAPVAVNRDSPLLHETLWNIPRLIRHHFAELGTDSRACSAHGRTKCDEASMFVWKDVFHLPSLLLHSFSVPHPALASSVMPLRCEQTGSRHHNFFHYCSRNRYHAWKQPPLCLLITIVIPRDPDLSVLLSDMHGCAICK